MEHLNIEIGTWKVTDEYGAEFIVTITEFSNYRGGAFSGPYVYVRNGEEHTIGCFPFEDIRKMEKCS